MICASVGSSDTISCMNGRDTTLFKQYQRLLRSSLVAAKAAQDLQPWNKLYKSAPELKHLCEHVNHAWRLNEKFHQYLDICENLPPAETFDGQSTLFSHMAVAARLWAHKSITVASYIEPVQLDFPPSGYDFICIELIDNAYRYTPANSAVKIGFLKLPDGSPQLSVSSPLAKKIDKSEMANIGEPFFRSVAACESGPGAGLSLANIKKICDVSGAVLDITSKDGYFNVVIKFPRQEPLNSC